MTAKEYIKCYTRSCSNELENGEYEYWLTPWQAEAACNLKKEEAINKACELLNDLYIEDRNCFLVKEDIEAFRKAMEEQL